MSEAVSSSRRSLLLGAALVAVAVAIGATTLVQQRGEQGEPVRVVSVERRGITQKVLAQGKVRAKSQVEVASEIGGRVNAVEVKVGDAVKKGALLFSIDDEQLKNTVAQLRVALAGAEAGLRRGELAVQEADRGVARDKGLREKGVLADEQLKLSESRAEMARAELEQARAGIERTRLDLQRAEDALRRAKVTAPIGGTVVAVGVEVGQVVSAVQGLASGGDGFGLGLGAATSGPGAPIVIADLSSLMVKLDVDELDVGVVREGQRAVVRAQGLKDYAFVGTVERVGLMGRDQAGAVLFVVEVGVQETIRDAGKTPSGPLSASTAKDEEPPPEVAAPASALPLPRDILRSGMSAQADIEVQHLENVIVIPVSAVLEGDGAGKADRLFVWEGAGPVGVAREISVRLGAAEDDSIAVLSGLSDGQRVIHGPFRALRNLEDGAPVVVAPEEDANRKGPSSGPSSGTSG